MTWEEIQEKAMEYIKWISPDLMYQNILKYISVSDTFFEKEIERRFNEYKADPRYENLTDQCLMDMAKADIEASKEAYGALYYLFSSIVNIILDLIEQISYYLGRADVSRQIGIQKANYEAGISIPDITILVDGLFKGVFSTGEFETFLRRLGFAFDVTEKIKDSMRPLLDLTTVTTLWQRGHLSTDEATKELVARGYDEDRANKILTSSLRLISPDMIRMLYLRGEIDEQTHDKLLASHGFPDEHIAYAKKLYEIIPPVSDIITMAVREAFSPEIAERFGQYEDFPEEFAEWAAKQGLSREWAERYWAAHWALPSVMQGYEMLHRGIIDEEELKMLMRALDIMPFWRDKLIQMSYSPFTRVDVRRMYRDGVIDREDVKRTYLDLGYDDWHAEKLTEWTITESLSEERKLCRSLIEGLYRRRIFTREEAKEALIAVKYREEVAEAILAKVDYDIEYQYKNRIISAVKKQYLRGIIDENQAITKLGRANLLATEIEQLIYEWQLEKEAQVRWLTPGEIKSLARKKIISHSTFIDKMTQIGYTRDDAELLWEDTQRKG